MLRPLAKKSCKSSEEKRDSTAARYKGRRSSWASREEKKRNKELHALGRGVKKSMLAERKGKSGVFLNA